MFQRFLFALIVLSSAGRLVAQDSQAPDWSTLDVALERSAQKDQLTLVYVKAPWCGLCKRMERDVFPQTLSLLSRLDLAQLDFADRDSRLRVADRMHSPGEWARILGIEATPGFALVDSNGQVRAHSTGYLDVDAFSLLAAYAVTGAYRHASFEEYVKQTRR